MSEPALTIADLNDLVNKIDEVLERLPPPRLPKYFTIAGAAEYSSLSEESIRGFVDLGKLQAFRPNGRLLIDRLELEQFVATSTKRPRKGRGIWPRKGRGIK